MKKLLGILGTFGFLCSSSSVVGCSYIDFYKQSIKNKISELVDVTQLALYPAIAGAAGTDGVSARTELNSKKVKDFSDLSQDSTIKSALNGYFGDDFNIFSLINKGNTSSTEDSEKYISNIDGLSNDNVKQMYGTEFEENQWSTISGAFNSVYGIVGQGLSPQLCNTLLSLLSGLDISGAATTIDSALESINGFLGEIDSTTIESHFKEINDTIETNQDYLYWFFSDICYLLNDCLNNGENNDNLFTVQTLKDKAKGLLSTDIPTQLENDISSFVKLIFDNSSSFEFNINSFIKYLPTALYALSKYVDSFDSYVNENVKDKTTLSDDDMEHLFSSQNTNFEVETNVATGQANNKDDTLSEYQFSGLTNIISLISGSYGSEYEFNRILQILFNCNDHPNDMRLLGTPSSGDGTIDPKYDKNSGTNGILMNNGGKGFVANNVSKYSLGLEPLLAGVVKGLFVQYNLDSYIGLANLIIGDVYSIIGNLLSSILANNNLEELISSIPTDIAGVFASSLGSIISGLISFDTKQLEPLIPTFKEIAKYMDRPINEILFGDNVVPKLIQLLQSVNIQIPDEFKNIKNITELFNIDIDIQGMTFKLNDVLPIVVQLVPLALTNFSDFKKLIELCSENPKDKHYQFWDGNYNKQTSDGSNDEGVLYNGVLYKSNLSLGLGMLNLDRVGWVLTSDDFDTKTSVCTAAKKILGYDSNAVGDDSDSTIIPDSILESLSVLLNKKGSSSLQQTLLNIKSFISTKSSDTSKERIKILDGYLNKNNFKTSDISYTNFTSSEEPSNISYEIHYNYNSIKLDYKVALSLDTSISKTYKFTKIEKI